MSITGSVGGLAQPIDGYVRSLRRRGHICAPGQQSILALDPSFPYSVDTADDMILWENGHLVFTGYVSKVTRQRPSYDWVIEGVDAYTKALSYFVPDKLLTGYDQFDNPVPGYEPQSTDYWIGVLMGYCDLAYQITSPSHLVPQGVQIGLRTVHEALQDILAYCSSYAYVDQHGTCIIFQPSSVSSKTLSSFTDYHRRNDDEWTRNYIKVYGYAGLQGQIFASANKILPHIIPDRVTAVASPMIGTAAEAQRVADYLLDVLGEETVVVTGTIVGDPSIRIGQHITMEHEDYSDDDIVTSIEYDWDMENGYQAQITIGERCPRIAGWSKPPVRIYAGTISHGIYRSPDNGLTWEDFNGGLPGGVKNVPRIAFNALEEGMAIVNNSVYYVYDSSGSATSGSWAVRALPAPQNLAGDVPNPGHGTIVAVDAMGGAGEFAILTMAMISSGSSSGSQPLSDKYRSWIYTTSGSGAATISSTQLSIPELGSEQYNVRAYDISSAYGAPYVVADTGQGWQQFGFKYHKGQLGIVYDYNNWTTGLRECRMVSNGGVMDWWVGTAYLSNIDIADWYAIVNVPMAALVPYGLRRDNVFLYGTSNGTFTAGSDPDGWRVWDYQKDFQWNPFNDPYHPELNTYLATIQIPVWYPTLIPRNPMTVNFGFFFSRYGSDNFYSWGGYTTGSDSCDELQHWVGSSPWGDTYSFGSGRRIYAYPFKSTLSAGWMEIGE